jgi:hypothetical protein
MAKRLAFCVIAIGLAGLARPAAAQISLGSPSDPGRIALGVGAFDITPNSGIHHGGTAGEFRGEYRFPDTLWILAPFVGVSVTTDGAFYGYGGIAFDINFSPNWVLSPNGAVGYFGRGSGTNLGSSTEFRTGAELAYRFDDMSRLGVNFNHTSNAGIGKHNPGEQSVVLMYSIPWQ